MRLCVSVLMLMFSTIKTERLVLCIAHTVPSPLLVVAVAVLLPNRTPVRMMASVRLAPLAYLVTLARTLCSALRAAMVYVRPTRSLRAITAMPVPAMLTPLATTTNSLNPRIPLITDINHKQKTTMPKSSSPTYQTIEQGSCGATYQNGDDTFTVYEIGTYGRSSVLAGQQRRQWLDQFPTLAEARAAYPKAEFIEGSTFREVSLDHLPDDEG